MRNGVQLPLLVLHLNIFKLVPPAWQILKVPLREGTEADEQFHKPPLS